MKLGTVATAVDLDAYVMHVADIWDSGEIETDGAIGRWIRFTSETYCGKPTKDMVTPYRPGYGMLSPMPEPCEVCGERLRAAKEG